MLLLDEPLGALDRKLREDMQIELRQLHSTLGTTFIYVTHDQEEALSMSDRLVVMRDGEIEQHGRARHGIRLAGDALGGGLRRREQPVAWRDSRSVGRRSSSRPTSR